MQRKRSLMNAEATQPIRVRQIPAQRNAVPVPAPRRPASAPVQNARPAVQPRYTQPAYPAQPPVAPAPRPGYAPANLPQRPVSATKNQARPLLWIGVGILILSVMTCGTVTLGMGLIYAGGILPGVSSGGVALGGLSETQAIEKLNQEWQTITVRDGQRAWKINPASLGITLNTPATAQNSYAAGRSNLGALIPGILARVEIAPVVSVDTVTAESGLQQMTSQFQQAAVNAGVRLVNGQVEATKPVNGRVLDINATLAQLESNAGSVLADGMLELVMQSVQPSVTDSTPMLEQAIRLLSSPLDIRLYDPVTGDSVYWSAMPEEWGNWLTATTDASSSSGLTLTANDQSVRNYLNSKAATGLDSSRYLDLDEAVSNIQENIARGETTPYARVYHHDGQYVVQSGETITSIAWDVGVPYLFIQEANGGLSNVSPGQTITIPSPDNFLPYPVVPDKRIVVSISGQRTTVYENGVVKWDWATSTGINDSPTWPGIYQIISHEPNAYAGNWDLWMPNFMGVYQPIPGSDFTNGFHGFPTRGGWQLLWTNSLGTRVTYGCILLSNENAQLLYDWAEEGVVVEITR
jgi:lipoprotein-anchoring transpeptidase ErfK/SrfK